MFVKYPIGLFPLFFLFRFTNGFALPHEGLYRLDIIHYNDFHARFEETSVEKTTCLTNNASCLGGFARMYEVVRMLKAEKPEALLLNAGDSFQGTYWYTLLKWNVTQRFMNLLPHDAHALGNHEFDQGPAGLAPYLRSLKAPIVAANMDTTLVPEMQGLYKPHVIIERNRRKIGVIGLITTDTATLSLPGNVTFTDPLEAVKRESDLLAAKGVDIIIVLSHCGLNMDKIIARDHGKNIDVIVGGHSHSLLWNGEAPSGEIVEGPYPVIIQPTAESQHKVLIVQASAFTKYIGNLSVYFDIHGEYAKWDGGPIFLNRSIPEDEDIKAKLEPYAKLVRETEKIKVGETRKELRFEDCVFGECMLGDLLTDGMNERAQQTVNSSFDHLAFIQRGNIKSSISEGVITQGDVFGVLPYYDRVESFELSGRDVLAALEHSVSAAWSFSPFKGPKILQVSGLYVTYNVSQPEGQRVTSVYIGDNTSSVELDKESVYQVSTPSYLAGGGDGFNMFKIGKRNVVLIGRDQDIIVAYLKKHSPLEPALDGRIKINY